jgi:CRISPR/Cas system-associated exonuclease Cas4 (RecB family)
MKHVDSLPVSKTLDEHMKDYFKLALYSYYFSIIDNKRKSFDALIKRWEELWFTPEMGDAFEAGDLKNKSNEAVSMMMTFWKRFGDEIVQPVAVNFGYEAVFPGKENLHVTGEIDLIKVVNDRTRKRETCISFFSLSSKLRDTFMVKNDICISVASYAFRSNFKAQEDKIVISNVLCADDTPSLRTGNDFVRAEKSIRNICRAIKGGVFYPAPNQINCSKCVYKTFCLNEKSVPTGGEL